MHTLPTTGANLSVHLIDGSCHHYQQTGSEDLVEILEHLRRTKVFSSQNLVFHINHEIAIFPSHAVSRLDIVTPEHLEHICSSTYRDSEEITPEEYIRERGAILRTFQADRTQLVQDGVFTMLLSYHLLGGYQVYIKCKIAREEDDARPFTQSDFSMLNQHIQAPVVTVGRLGGGLTFLNTVNILCMGRCPGSPDRPLNALDVNDMDSAIPVHK